MGSKKSLNEQLCEMDDVLAKTYLNWPYSDVDKVSRAERRRSAREYLRTMRAIERSKHDGE